MLADNIAYLCRSLGLAAYVYEKRKECVNNGKWGTYYRIGISGNFLPLKPHVRIRRKKERIYERKQVKNVLHTGFVVKKTNIEDYYGFELDSDNLYLLDDFTVTHNSGKSACLQRPLLGAFWQNTSKGCQYRRCYYRR